MRAMNMGRRVCVGGSFLAAVAVLLVPAAAAAADRPTVRVTRPAAGRIVLDVADDTVAVRKEITADRSVVTLTTAKDRLSITIHRGVLSVSGPRGTTTMEPGGMDSDRLLVVLQRSDAAARALKLLEQVSEGPETFVGQSFLLTRVILESGTGSVNALNRQQQWVAERAAALAVRPGQPQGGPMVIRAAWVEPVQKTTPGDCWDIYSKEAIRIADDFNDCTDGLRWWEAHKWAGCSLIYSVRSEGAMAWFISCNGGVPFNG